MSRYNAFLKSLLGCSVLVTSLAHTTPSMAAASCKLPKAGTHNALQRELRVNRLYTCALSGDASAQLHLGRLLSHADDDDESNLQAINWYKKAAKQGLAEAQYELAMHYLDGDGVEENRYIAMDWLDRAARQGHKDAKFIYNHLMNDDFAIGC